jgi:nucleoside-diphosphate-sugar epimerase
VEALRAAGRPVIGLDIRPGPSTTVIGDIRRPPLEETLEAIIHCAAQVSVAASVEDPRADASHNVLGTIGMLELARRSEAKRFVFFSSAAVYGVPARALPRGRPASAALTLRPRESRRRALRRALR